MLRLIFRDRVAVFWSFAFPVIIFGLMAATTGRFYPASANGSSGLMMLAAGVIAIAITSGGLFGIGAYLVGARESGVLLRYRTLPVRSSVIMVCTMMRNAVVTALAIALLYAIARLLAAAGPVSAPVLLIVIAVGVLGFSGFGILITSFVRTHEASAAVCNLLFYLMMFLSGATVPRMFMPGWLNAFAVWLTTTQLVDALVAVLYLGRGIAAVWSQLLYFLVFGAAAGAAAAFRFRWS